MSRNVMDALKDWQDMIQRNFITITQHDDVTFSWINGLKPEIHEWLNSDCAWEFKLEGYQDGGRVRLTFLDPRASVEFKLRWENVEWASPCC